jgi:hypothetical protein
MLSHYVEENKDEEKDEGDNEDDANDNKNDGDDDDEEEKPKPDWMNTDIPPPEMEIEELEVSTYLFV